MSLASGASRASRKSPWLHGNWAPAPATESPVADLPVVGVLPGELDGAFMRVGPNPPRVPKSPLHLFDGDGAVALFRIEDGKASFCWD